MNEITKLVLAVFGGVMVLAIISVIISKKSQSPAVIQALSSGLANVVAAAVNPVNTASTNGSDGTSSFTTPSIPGGASLITNAFNSFANGGFNSSIFT